MKKVIGLAALLISLNIYAQNGTEVQETQRETGAETASLSKKAAHNNTLQTLPNVDIVEKDTLVNGEKVTILRHDKEYSALAKFEQMLAKRLEIDAAESHRRESRKNY